MYVYKSWIILKADELLLLFPFLIHTSAFLSDFLQAMTLMEYLIKTGSERVAQQCRENIYAVQTLKDFQYIDRDGKDQVKKLQEEFGLSMFKVHSSGMQACFVKNLLPLSHRRTLLNASLNLAQKRTKPTGTLFMSC